MERPIRPNIVFRLTWGLFKVDSTLRLGPSQRPWGATRSRPDPKCKPVPSTYWNLHNHWLNSETLRCSQETMSRVRGRNRKEGSENGELAEPWLPVLSGRSAWCIELPRVLFFFFKPKSRFTAKLESLDSSDISPAPHVLAFPIVNIPYQGDTLVITDEPTWRYRHSKPIAYIIVHPRCCTFCSFGQMYDDIYPPL